MFTAPVGPWLHVIVEESTGFTIYKLFLSVSCQVYNSFIKLTYVRSSGCILFTAFIHQFKTTEDDGVDLSMGEEKPEPLDFVKDFQEYLSQQTQHVNMISGSVIGGKDSEGLQGGNAQRAFQCVVLDLAKYVPKKENSVITHTQNTIFDEI